MNVVVPASIYQKKQRCFSHMKSEDKKKAKLCFFDILALILGFFLGQAVLLKGLSPFGVAYLAIFSKSSLKRLLLIGMGVGAGTLLGKGWQGLGFMLSAVLGIYLVRLFRAKITHDSIRGVLISGMVLGYRFLCYSLIDGDLYKLLMGVIEALFILFISWLFMEGAADLFLSQHKRFDRTNLLAIILLTAGVVIGLPALQVVGVTVKEIFIQILIMVVAYVGGVTSSTVLGMILGLALSLTDLYNPALIGTYGFIGISAGFFREYGRIAIVLGMTLAVFVFTGLGIIDATLYEVVISCLIAGTIFFTLPNSFLRKFQQTFLGFAEMKISDDNYPIDLQERFRERLEEFSQVFTELGATFKEVSAVELEDDDLSNFLNIISNRVCKGCDYVSHCWDKQFYQTYTQIFKLLTLLENKGQAQSDDFIQLLKGHCRNLSRLKKSVESSLDIYKLQRQWSHKLKEQQAIVADQLSEMARIINDFSKELVLCRGSKEDLELLLKLRLSEEGINVANCRVVGDVTDEKLNISILKENCAGASECRKIFKLINYLIPQPMNNYERSCSLETGQRLCCLQFCPARRFKVNLGFCSKPSTGEIKSGDTLMYQQLKSGKFMTILSDGMGTGEDAARESRSAARLVQKIIKAGFDHELAVRTVNTALLSRSREECFATLDIAFIDLLNGELELIKIGAAATFIKRGHDVNLVRGSSLPVGILQSVEPNIFKRRLISGDFVVMMTDGILDAVKISNKEDWMARLLRQCSFDSPNDLAAYLYEQAIGKGNQEDDMTVVVLQLEKETIH